MIRRWPQEQLGQRLNEVDGGKKTIMGFEERALGSHELEEERGLCRG